LTLFPRSGGVPLPYSVMVSANFQVYDTLNKGSNDDWQHPHDPAAKVIKLFSGSAG
jgi:hypothetical protein